MTLLSIWGLGKLAVRIEPVRKILARALPLVRVPVKAENVDHHRGVSLVLQWTKLGVVLEFV